MVPGDRSEQDRRRGRQGNLRQRDRGRRPQENCCRSEADLGGRQVDRRHDRPGDRTVAGGPMKLRKLEVESFRGSPGLLSLTLKIDKSHLIFAENGRGKSTVPDAVEFLTTGGL